MTALPREINYAPKLNALPNSTSCLSAVVAPSNGQIFADGGAFIQFDLPSRGFLVPGSLYIRYKATAVCPGAANVSTPMKGTPVYTPIARVETIIGSAIVESISQYNQLANIIVNTKLNHAQKAGLAYGFGIGNAANDTITYDNLNGRNVLSLGAGQPVTWFMSGPLGCILSNSSHLVPLNKMPGCRIQLTTETLGNMFQSLGAATPTSFTMTNVELCFDLVDFGSEIDSVVDSMADENGNIYIKSQSYSSINQSLPVASSGMVELVYNQRYSSIKSLIANISRQSTTIANGIFDSVDITTNNGDYQFLVASAPFPPRPLSTVQNKAGILMELSNCWGPVHDMTSSNMSITPLEFSRTSLAAANATSYLTPGKFYVGVNTERLSTAGNLLTGVSSQLSPISLRMNIGTATAENSQITLVTCFDSLLEINITTRQVAVKQ
jgi:hypothetical protein